MSETSYLRQLEKMRQQNAAQAGTAALFGTPEPDATAEGLKIGSELGVPPSIVAGAPDVFRERLAQQRATTALTQAPRTTSWLRSSDINGSLAKDDLENLAWFETQFMNQPNILGGTGIEGQPGAVRGVASGIQSMGEIGAAAATIPAALRRNTNTDMLNRFETAMTLPAGASRERIAQAFGVEPDNIGVDWAINFLSSDEETRAALVGNTMRKIMADEEVITFFADKAKEYREEAMRIRGDVPTFTQISDVKDFIDWFATTSGEALPFLATFMALSAVGGTPALMAGSYVTGVGDVQASLLEAGVSDRPGLAVTFGAPYALAERIGAPARLNRTGVMDRAMQSYFRRMVAEAPKTMLEEGVNEVLQEITVDIATAIGTGEGFDFSDEAMLKYLDVAAAGAVGGLSVSPVTTVAQAEADRKAAAAGNAGGTAERLASIEQMALQSKVRERSPDKFREALEAQGYRGEEVFVDAGDLQTFFQSQGGDVNPETLRLWGVDPDTFEERVTAGQDVAIPLSAYAAHIAGTDAAAWVADNAVSGENEMSLAQSRTFRETMAEDIRQAEESARAVVEGQRQMDESEQRVFDDVYEQLRTAGQTPTVAGAQALLYASFFRANAERSGQEIDYLRQRFGLEIRGPETAGSAPSVQPDPVAEAAAAEAPIDTGTIESPPPSPVAAIPANGQDVAITAAGREVPVTYRVIDAGALITSQTDDGRLNPDFPAELQPRDRSRDTSMEQIRRIAQNLDPRLLGPNPSAADGAPIVSPEGIVESGNGRVLAIRQAYAGNPERAAAYRAYVESLGYPTEGMTMPVLVRERGGDMAEADRRAFTREANERSSMELSDTERAMADADALPDDALALYQGGDVDLAQNRDFVRAFLTSAVSESDRGAFIDTQGRMSQRAVRRVQAALLAKAYGDATLVERIMEVTDGNIKAIGGALMDVAPMWAQMRREATNGVISPEMDQTEALLEAVNMIRRARDEGRNIQEFVGQTDIFSGEAMTPAGEGFLRLFFRDAETLKRPAGRVKVAQALGFYVEEARKAAPGMDLLGDVADPLAILTTAKERQYEDPDAQGQFFAQSPLGAGESDQPGSGSGPGQSGAGTEAEGGAGGRASGVEGAIDPQELRQPGRVVRIGDLGDVEGAVALRDIKQAQGFVDVDDLMARGAVNHEALTAAIAAAAETVGAAAKAAPLKGRARVEEKVAGKYAGNVNGMTDVARGGIDATTLDQADDFVRILSETYSLVDEGWTFTAEGYFDRKVLVVFPDGQIGEVQIWPPGMLEAKEERGGHRLYEVSRSPASTDAEKAEAVAGMLALYGEVTSALDVSWSGILPPSAATVASNRDTSTSGDRSSAYTSDGVISPQDAPSGEMDSMAPSSVSMAGVDPSTRKNLIGNPPSSDALNIDTIGGDGNGPSAKGRTLFQDLARGSIQFPAGGIERGTTIINLFETSDLSTFLHESGHFFLEAFAAIASDANAPQSMRDDLAAIYQFLEADPGKPLETRHHEKWARGFEAYLMEGAAPSLALADAFARFKSWLVRIYQTAMGLNVTLTPEIRDVMDRMLATENQIAEARAEQSMTPLFTEAPVGMNPRDFEAYQRMARRSQEKAEQTLLSKMMARILREKKAWYREEKKAVREEVAREINARPEYRLIDLLANQSIADQEGTDVPDMRIDRETLVEQFGEDVLAQLDRKSIGGKRAIYGPEGDSPAEIAEFFGFDSPQAMIQALAAAGKKKEVIAAETEQRMVERYGDPFEDGTIEEEALAAIHNEQQASTAVAEARQLARQMGRDTRSMKLKLYRQRARMMVGRMTVREVMRPGRFLAAERKAARTAQDAFGSVVRGAGGQSAIAEALFAKEQQILNGFMYDEARKVAEQVRKGREKMRSYDKKSVREKLAGGYIEQIDAILDRFDFRVRGQRQIQRAESLDAFIQRMIQEGREGELTIDDRLRDEARRTHYTRMTVDEIRGLFDTIENIDHLGRFKERLRSMQKKRELARSAARVAEQIATNVGTGRAKKESRLRSTVDLLWTTDTILVEMDGLDEYGPAYQEIKEAIDRGQSEEQRMFVELSQKLDDLFAVYTPAEIRDMQKARVVPGDGRLWSKTQIISVALNTGNSDNLQRLLADDAHESVRMNRGQLDALLATLDKRDWDFVQSMWDAINDYWPQIAETEERRTGVRPKKVEAIEVETPHGLYRGGYYPIDYDPGLSQPAALDEQTAFDAFQSAGRFGKAQTANGHTKQRQKSSGGRTLNLDLGVAFKHMRDVVHGIALAEAVDDAYRILNHPLVYGAFQEAGRRNDHRVLNLWLKDLAHGPLYNSDVINSLARMVKNNFTLSRLALNMKTVVLQATGLGQSAATIGKVNMLRGMLDYRKRPLALAQEVMEKSAFMRERQSTFQKDIYDFANDVKMTSPLAGRWMRSKDAVSKFGFAPIVKMQFYTVDMPTWLGAYRAGLERFKGDRDAEGRAIQYADRMVARAQDSGLMGDRPAVSRGTLSETTRQSDVVRLFTTLAGYMMTKMNRANITVRRGVRDVRQAESAPQALAGAANAATDLALLYISEAALMALLYALIADDDWDEEDLQAFMLRETGSAVFGGIPFVRDAVSAFAGFGGGGVYGSVLEVPARLWTQAVQGENDRALRRSIADAVGIATGLPSTAGIRAIEQLASDEDPPMAEMLFGTNPLTRD